VRWQIQNMGVTPFAWQGVALGPSRGRCHSCNASSRGGSGRDEGLANKVAPTLFALSKNGSNPFKVQKIFWRFEQSS
jgi:hypothetical protein